jgi:hypothetical protein
VTGAPTFPSHLLSKPRIGSTTDKNFVTAELMVVKKISSKFDEINIAKMRFAGCTNQLLEVTQSN